ncbi:hypothetical protein RJ639_017588 [Escallonia herrerae]|uniref:Protein kinase domain-containing protein n=1 Tax=Escallonia herrerae TaxID=1293975 RepID=A0AA88VEG8_9ASTE|nr:hypothetical protein RJ639_017588 [Escallonia herrerae]
MVPLILFLWLMIAPPSIAVAATPSLAKPGCDDHCGNVSIPYPFGIGSNCYLDQRYDVTCNQSFNPPIPYLTSLSLQVLSVSLKNKTVTINNPVVKGCRNSTGNEVLATSKSLEGTPFVYSGGYNKFTVLGCGNAILGRDGIVMAGCSSICSTNGTRQLMGCYGINCCETTIPFVLKSYHVSTQGDCVSGFLVDENWIGGYNISDPRYSVENIVPVVLRWTLLEVDIPSCIRYNTTFQLPGNTLITTWYCRCGWAEEGNPYLADGCQGTLLDSRVGISMGTLFLIIGIFWLYKIVLRIKNKKRKEKFFRRNGGLLLQHQTSVDKGSAEKPHFSAKQLEKATDNFNENRILGRGGQGTVYKGMLTDGRIVAVKKSKIVDESQLKQFINEVVILMLFGNRSSSTSLRIHLKWNPFQTYPRPKQ